GLSLLVAAIKRANRRIITAAERDPAKRGMGTTIVSVLDMGDRVAVAHVGDSRCYRFRNGRIERLTEDHSLLTEYIRYGNWDPDGKGSFPFAHMLTRALGGGETVEVETRVVQPEAGDVLVLCSDGLSGVVADAEIAEILDENTDLAGAIDRLIARADDEGGPD